MCLIRVDFCSLGPDDEEFSVEVHHGGFFCGSGVDRVYLDGKVDWFHHIKVQYWSFYAVDEISMVLGFDLGVPVYWLLPDMDLSVTPSVLPLKQLAKLCHEPHVYVSMHVIMCVDQIS